MVRSCLLIKQGTRSPIELKRHSRVIWALAGGKVTNGESGYSQHEDEKGKTLRDFGILERKYTIVQILNIWLE